MELKDLTIQLNDNLKVTNIRWKSRSIEISTDGGKTFRRPTYYETINLYTADLCDCDGGSGTGGTVNTEKLKEQIKEAIINDETFKAEVAKLVKVENPEVDTDAIETNVKNSIIEDKVFKSEIAKAVTVDTESIKTDIKKDETFKSDIAKLIEAPEVDTDAIKTSVKTDIKADSEFKKEIADSVTVDTESIKTDIKNDASFKSDIAGLVETPEVDTDTITTTVETNIKKDDSFKSEVAKLVEAPEVDTNSITTTVETNIKKDETFKAEVAKLVTPSTPTVDTDAIKTEVKSDLKSDTDFKKEIADSVTVDTESIKTDIKNDTEFKSSVAKLVTVPEVDTDTIATNVKTNLKEDTEFKSELAELVEVPTLSNTDTLEKFSTNDSGELLFNGSKLEADVTVDEEMSDDSENAVQNKVIKKYIDDKSRTIVSMTKDDEDNINVVYSDGTKQSIGKLKVDLQGNFLTEGGFGNLRYYNGKLQYYDSDTSSWVDGTVTSDNQLIVNITPQNMRSFIGTYDKKLKKIKLKFKEPSDTVIDNQSICIVEKVIIRRKKDSAPESETDGDLVLEIKRKDFGTYSNGWFIDTELSPIENDIYYYKAFPVSTSGIVNKASEELNIECVNFKLYGFRLNQNESDPDNMITYISNNSKFKSAKMNFETGVFDYGDWNDAWFIKNIKPCMLNFDGTVAYELDKNDYTKKSDGITASEVADLNFAGNAMVGIPKVYCKIVDNNDNTIDFYFSDTKIDDNYHCWSHIDPKGNEIDFSYFGIYNTVRYNSRVRSIKNQNPAKVNTNGWLQCKNNNLGSDRIWHSYYYTDWMLISLLCVLIGKSTDVTSVFGKGNINNQNEPLISGTMDDKGLFFGSNDNSVGVKIFGLENIWGNINKWIEGASYTKGIFKFCPNVSLYSENWIEVDESTLNDYSGGYISKIKIDSEHNVLYPESLKGSSSTYFCDSCLYSNTLNDGALFMGGSSLDTDSGILLYHLDTENTVAGISNNYSSCLICCKPLASTDTTD